MENSNGSDNNVGSIKEAIKIIEEKLKQAKDYSDITGLCITLDNELCTAFTNILSDYKKILVDFREVDSECFRLEKKEIELGKENYSLQCQYDKALEDLVKGFKVKQELKGKLKELKVKWEEMRPYRDISPHDFGYISGQIDILTEILSKMI